MGKPAMGDVRLPANSIRRVEQRFGRDQCAAMVARNAFSRVAVHMLDEDLVLHEIACTLWIELEGSVAAALVARLEGGAALKARLVGWCSSFAPRMQGHGWTSFRD